MRIAILTTQCPFVIGGAELHAASLVRALREAGHEAEIVSMPFKWYPSATILDHMLAARSMDVSEFNPAVEGYRTGRLVANLLYYFAIGVALRR